MTVLKRLEQEIKALARPERAKFLQRFFKTGPGQYAAGDVFLGLSVPEQRALARRYRGLDRKGIRALLSNPYHEFRLVGLLILVDQYQRAATSKEKADVSRFYESRLGSVNNWDLVDLSAAKILGAELVRTGSGAAKLLRLARSAQLWRRRVAMVATYAHILDGSGRETFLLAEELIDDKEDLIHKASGWMLREAGKRLGEPVLLKFLDEHGRRLPRTALRYAIERLSPAKRQYYLRR